MGSSSIEWTDKTWNPVVGCTRVSPGCEHCYAETMAARNVLMSAAQGRVSPYLPVVDAQRRRWSREVAMLPERLAEPLSWRPGTKVFVVSMGDLFHDGVSFDFITAVWGVMAATPGVTYQVLTKRPARVCEFFTWLERREESMSFGWTPQEVCMVLAGVALDTQSVALTLPKKRPAWPLPNVWLGTSVEDQQRADERIPLLLAAPAAVRFLSAEPLLGPLDLGRWLGDYDCHACCTRFWGREVRAVDRLVSVGEEAAPNTTDVERDICPRCGQPDLGTGDVGPVGGDYEGQPTIDWVIVGGESGPGARPMDPSWVRSLSTQCRIAEAAFFFKQWGGVRKGEAGRELDGRTHDAMPGVRP